MEKQSPDFETVMKELASLGKERTKKSYMSRGAKEPLFGVATGAMKPLSKKIGINQPLAEALYATGNYDAMYFAGIIADPNGMSEADYDRWMDDAYFFMISDYIVAVTLSESDSAQKVADRWIRSREDLRMSAGYSCYCWLLGNRKDSEFNKEKLLSMMRQVQETIHEAPVNAKKAMGEFLYTIALSYLPLHEEAMKIAEELGEIDLIKEEKKTKTIHPIATIQKELDRGRLGFKRKYVRC
ncbi:DNA alkylation repair protein [Proteiniclasticum sp. C24MP]|uniref:DNA alkylation repair protein n=1 Tax=Proteiniclasticum sp. C24MP TaxID=3374101 RepID=UPI0037546CB6